MEFHDHVNPVLLRQEVGRRLRCAREEVDLNVLDAATRLDIGASTVSRIESGRTQVSTTIVQAMMELYRLDDDELLDMVSRARRPGWWKRYGFPDDHFIALETGASRMCDFEPEFIPGLLQTADYARVLFGAGMKRRGKMWIDRELDARRVHHRRAELL